MNSGINAIARLLIEELPGLAGLTGAIQPMGGGQSSSELVRQQRNQNLANTMLAAASGLLMPSPNRYPLAPLQRLGAGLGAALQTYNEGAQQARVLDALRMEGGGLQSGTDAIAPQGLGGVAPVQPARIAPAPRTPESAAGESAVSERQRLGPALRRTMSRNAVSMGPVLRRFNGRLARRLEHPAILPGGWELYGYEEETGNPVYAGPGQELRIYA
jgi:hypothetical protein